MFPQRTSTMRGIWLSQAEWILALRSLPLRIPIKPPWLTSAIHLLAALPSSVPVVGEAPSTST